MSLKRALYLASYYGGADRLARFGSRTRGAIVMFHRVVDRPWVSGFHPNRELEVTPDVLRAIIRGLREGGFEIIPIGSVPDRMNDGTSPPFACLTFDDGYRDNLTVALPVCAELKAPLTVYLTSGFMDRTSTIWWEDLAALVRTHPKITMTLAGEVRGFETQTLKQKARAYDVLSHHLERAPLPERESCLNQMAERYGVDGVETTRSLALSWAEARELAKHPLVTIGAHTNSHPTLASLTAHQARSEIEESRSRLESQLDLKVTHFAYPYGGKENASDREFAMCKELGFATAVTTRFGLIENGKVARHALPRVTSNSFDDERTLRVKLSGLPALFSSH